MTDFSSFGNSSVPWWNAFFTHSPTRAFTCTHTLTCFTLTEDIDSKKYRKDDCWLLERVQSKASRSNWGWMNSSALFGTYQKDWITPRNILSLIPAWLNHWDQVVRNLKLIEVSLWIRRSGTYVSLLSVYIFQETLPNISHSVITSLPITLLLSSVGCSFPWLTEASETGVREYMEWHIFKSFQLQRVFVRGQRV